jgi:cytochrome P450
VVLVAEAHLARQVLTTHQRHLRKSPVLRRARVVLGDGLLTSEGAHHRRHRRAVQPALHREHVAAWTATMAEVAAAEVGGWRGSVDAGAAAHRIALEVASRLLLGADTRDQAAELRAALDDLLRAYPLALLPLGERLAASPLLRRLHRAVDRFDSLIAAAVADRRAGAPADDVLGALLAQQEAEGLDEAEVRDELVTLLLAGHETTAAALTWALHRLAHHPEAQRWAAGEVAGLPAGPATAAPRVRAVAAEALRLHPPSWGIAREVAEPFRLAGRPVTPGDVLVVSPWVLHRDARWWVQPHRFAPERWDGTDPRRHTRAYLPFGAGSRMCAGEAFAWTELTVVLGEVLRRWRLAPSGPLPRPVASLTLRPSHAAPLRLTAVISPLQAGSQAADVEGFRP